VAEDGVEILPLTFAPRFPVINVSSCTQVLEKNKLAEVLQKRGD